MFFLRLVVVGVILCVAAPTRAEPAASHEPEQPKRTLDYRPILIVSDAVAAGLFLTAVSMNDGPRTEIAWTGAGVYVLGGPTVHLAHGQPLRSLVSLVARVTAPSVGAGVGGGLGLVIGCAASDDSGCIAYAVIGAGIGFIGGGLAAAIVDDAFLGRVPIEDDRPQEGRQRGVQAAVVPLVDPSRKTLGISLVGNF